MARCIQSTGAGACDTCGAQEKLLHQPVFGRGVYCAKCCPVCAEKPAAPVVAKPKRQAPPQPEAPDGSGQFKDLGYGPAADDPWNMDSAEDRAARSAPDVGGNWVPKRKWFKKRVA